MYGSEACEKRRKRFRNKMKEVVKKTFGPLKENGV
jgi:hypothetical protein